MDFDRLVNQIFREEEFYELLLTELEDHFEDHFSNYLHFYFIREPNEKIRITALSFFKDIYEMKKVSMGRIEKNEWFEVSNNGHDLVLLSTHLDRTGLLSLIGKNSTRQQEWQRYWLDEEPRHDKPMSPDEIRQAFKELAGVLNDEDEKQKLRFKKAV